MLGRVDSTVAIHQFDVGNDRRELRSLTEMPKGPNKKARGVLIVRVKKADKPTPRMAQSDIARSRRSKIARLSQETNRCGVGERRGFNLGRRIVS